MAYTKEKKMEDINNYHSQRVYFLIVLLKYVESKKLILYKLLNIYLEEKKI